MSEHEAVLATVIVGVIAVTSAAVVIARAWFEHRERMRELEARQGREGSQ